MPANPVFWALQPREQPHLSTAACPMPVLAMTQKLISRANLHKDCRICRAKRPCFSCGAYTPGCKFMHAPSVAAPFATKQPSVCLSPVSAKLFDALQAAPGAFATAQSAKCQVKMALPFAQKNLLKSCNGTASRNTFLGAHVVPQVVRASSASAHNASGTSMPSGCVATRCRRPVCKTPPAESRCLIAINESCH